MGNGGITCFVTSGAGANPYIAERQAGRSFSRRGTELPLSSGGDGSRPQDQLAADRLDEREAGPDTP